MLCKVSGLFVFSAIGTEYFCAVSYFSYSLFRVQLWTYEAEVHYNNREKYQILKSLDIELIRIVESCIILVSEM